MKLLPAKTKYILGMVVVLLAFEACKKDAIPTTPDNAQNNTLLPVHSRLLTLYGVTLHSPGVASIITTILPNGAVNPSPVYIDLGAGQSHVFEDLKGVCEVHGQVFVTTGPSEVDYYNNVLLKVDPLTGHAGIISHSTIGTVSDIDYDPSTGIIYGLLDNSNTLVTIKDNNNNWGDYAVVGPIKNLGGDFVAKGLSMVRDASGLHIVVAATSDTGGSAQVYTVPAGAGAATFLSVVTPADQLGGGHCGIGFNYEENIVLINRRPTLFVDGLNSFDWSDPLPNPVNSILWDITTGLPYQDLSSTLE